MDNEDQDTFCKKMRKATKGIHTISDHLVNAKLAFGKIAFFLSTCLIDSPPIIYYHCSV